MNELLPFIEVFGPDGQQFNVELVKDRITIGRFEHFNDVALEPDPQMLITRKAHCAVEYNSGSWWIADNGSVNRTFLRRGTVTEIVSGHTLLKEGDSIRILGRLTESGPIYWELIFRDPLGTRPADVEQSQACLEYDWLQAKLFLVDGLSRHEIPDLRPQEHKLIRYMDQRNRVNGGVPVMCTYEELIVAVWGEESCRAEADVNHLIWTLRQKIEPAAKGHQFLETVRGLGYRMVSRSLSR